MYDGHYHQFQHMMVKKLVLYKTDQTVKPIYIVCVWLVILFVENDSRKMVHCMLQLHWIALLCDKGVRMFKKTHSSWGNLTSMLHLSQTENTTGVQLSRSSSIPTVVYFFFFCPGWGVNESISKWLYCICE